MKVFLITLFFMSCKDLEIRDNEKIAELKVKYFQSKKNCVNLRDLGYNIEPFNPKSNFLYRKQ